MIDFQITQQDFAKAVRLMTSARTSAPDELVDLTCYTGNVRFVVTGRELTCPALVELKGQAQFPLAILPKLRQVAKTFPDQPLRLRFSEGRMKLNSMSVTFPGILVRKSTDRPIDIPDDAPIRDILALRYLFTQEEVAASDLALRYLAANSKRIKTIDSATAALSEFGIPPATIETLVETYLKAHAETLRPMLKPDLASSRPN